jgi:hypothetical protein
MQKAEPPQKDPHTAQSLNAPAHIHFPHRHKGSHEGEPPSFKQVPLLQAVAGVPGRGSHRLRRAQDHLGACLAGPVATFGGVASLCEMGFDVH